MKLKSEPFETVGVVISCATDGYFLAFVSSRQQTSLSWLESIALAVLSCAMFGVLRPRTLFKLKLLCWAFIIICVSAKLFDPGDRSALASFARALIALDIAAGLEVVLWHFRKAKADGLESGTALR